MSTTYDDVGPFDQAEDLDEGRQDGQPVIVLNEPGHWPDGIPRGEWLFESDPAFRTGRGSSYRATGSGVVLVVDATPHVWMWVVYLAPNGETWARGFRMTRDAAANAAAYSADRRAHYLSIGEPDPTRTPSSPPERRPDR